MNHVLQRNDASGRFELLVDGQVASFADFSDLDGVRVFPHTVTDPAFRGQGLAATLVRYALDSTRADELRVDPQCWFVREFIDASPDYQSLLAR